MKELTLSLYDDSAGRSYPLVARLPDDGKLTMTINGIPFDWDDITDVNSDATIWIQVDGLDTAGVLEGEFIELLHWWREAYPDYPGIQEMITESNNEFEASQAPNNN